MIGEKRGGRARDTAIVIRRVWYCCGSWPCAVPGGTLGIDLNDGDGISCCSSDKIYRLGGSRPCVFVNVGVRHCRQAGEDQGSSSYSQ